MTNFNKITVKPLIFFKGNTRLAIYGIGYIEDYQFNKLLNNNRVIAYHIIIILGYFGRSR